MTACVSWSIDPYLICVSVDPSALVLKNQLADCGIPYRDADNSVREGIAYCQLQLYSNSAYISKNCQKLIKEFGLYSYAKNSPGELVIKVNDDACDSMRYLLYTNKNNVGPLYIC